MGDVKWWGIAGAVAASAVALAAPAQADETSYITAMDQAQLIDHDGVIYECFAGKPCYGQFEDYTWALQTGRWVCDQLAGGKPRAMIVDWLSHGEGIMPSSYTAPIIVDTAVKHLCP